MTGLNEKGDAIVDMVQAFTDANANSDIQTVGRAIEGHVEAAWQAVFQACRDEMVEKYPEIGDSVYGIYGMRLFRPVHAALKAAGLKATPNLPGKFDISREWGDDERDRQRWMWSKIKRLGDGSTLGTIVIAYYHNHVEVDIPRAFRVIALEETGKREVVAALSALSPEFAAAKEATVEIAEYMAWLAEQEQAT